MNKIEKFILPEHTNTLYENEAISSISLTKEVAAKINELVDCINTLSTTDLEWKQAQEGIIRKGVVFMKDNLLNSLNDLMVLLRDSGFIDDRIKYHCDNLKSRLDNLIGGVTEGSTTLDAEVIDIRLDAFESTHKTAGESIRNTFKTLLDSIKNKYLESIGFYNAFDNIGWAGESVYNRVANTAFFELDKDIKVVAPYGYDVSVTIWNDGQRVFDSGWLNAVIIPRGFKARLCVRKNDNTAISVSDIYKLRFEEDTAPEKFNFFSGSLTYTSGGAYTNIRLNSGKFTVDKIAEIIAPKNYYVALKLYKEKDGKLNVYKDTGWTNQVTLPINYICELSFKKSVDTQILKSELNDFNIRYGNWNESAITSINENIFIDIMNSVTYGGWTTDTYTYNDTTFTRMVSGIFKADKPLKIKSNSNTKIALHLWKNNELGASSYLSASSWQSEVVIPKDRYFTLYFCGSDTSATMQLADLESYSMTEYAALETTGVSAVIDNVNVNSVAHRGYNIDAPENTLAAFRLAYEKGFKYVECDISFTKDNIPVLLHDSTIDRTSNGTGAINSMTFEQVRAFDFGSWFNSAFVGEVIPSFDEFITLCRNLGLHPYIEIKYGATQSQVESLVNSVNKHGMRGKVTYISFESELLSYAHGADEAARLGYVVNNFTTDNIGNILPLKNNNEVFIDCNFANVNENVINLCSANALPLEVWTVNDESAIKNMPPYVTGFTSDYLHAGNILKTII